MAQTLHLIVVGKLKSSELEAIENNYLKRISQPKLIIHEVRAKAENPKEEAIALEKKVNELKTGALIALTEKGSTKDSIEFSGWLEKITSEVQGDIVFLIAGAEGFDRDFLKQVQFKFSLSRLTFPHKLARILLVEQIYRAQTIRNNHPYHN